MNSVFKLFSDSFKSIVGAMILDEEDLELTQMRIIKLINNSASLAFDYQLDN